MVNPSSILLDLAAHDSRFYFVFDHYGKQCIFTNPAFEQFFSISSQQVTLPFLFNMVHQSDKESLRKEFIMIRSGGFRDNITFRIILPASGECWLKMSLYVQKESGGTISGYLEDISSAKAHDDKLNEFSNKKNAILTIVGHDLSGPLGTIQMLAQHLMQKIEASGNLDLERFVHSIAQISRNSHKMIQDLIKAEFIESAGVDLVKDKIDLAKALQTLVKEYQESADTLKISFSFVCNVPHLFTKVDEPKLLQAINNLISNAIKFTPEGGTIMIGLQQLENDILITVADTGIGIPEKYHATLFDKFNQARRQGLRGESSTGLGMSIVKTIVEWHNGKIWFESKPEVGTTFYINLQMN